VSLLLLIPLLIGQITQIIKSSIATSYWPDSEGGSLASAAHATGAYVHVPGASSRVGNSGTGPVTAILHTCKGMIGRQGRAVPPAVNQTLEFLYVWKTPVTGVGTIR
jgi:hypothetical protein